MDETLKEEVKPRAEEWSWELNISRVYSVAGQYVVATNVAVGVHRSGRYSKAADGRGDPPVLREVVRWSSRWAAMARRVAVVRNRIVG